MSSVSVVFDLHVTCEFLDLSASSKSMSMQLFMADSQIIKTTNVKFVNLERQLYSSVLHVYMLTVPSLPDIRHCNWKMVTRVAY